jgi:hypothetical protein
MTGKEKFFKIIENYQLKIIERSNLIDDFFIWQVFDKFQFTTDKIKWAALEKCPESILKFPERKEFIPRALELKPSLVKNLWYYCSEDQQMSAIKSDPNIISTIYNPPEKFIKYALECSEYDITIIVNLDISKFRSELIEEVYNNIIIKDIIE